MLTFEETAEIYSPLAAEIVYINGFLTFVLPPDITEKQKEYINTLLHERRNTLLDFYSVNQTSESFTKDTALEIPDLNTYITDLILIQHIHPIYENILTIVVSSQYKDTIDKHPQLPGRAYREDGEPATFKLRLTRDMFKSNPAWNI